MSGLAIVVVVEMMGEVIVHNEKGVPILVDRAVSAARPPRCKAGLSHNTVVMGKAGGARVQMDLRLELSGAADAAQIWELLHNVPPPRPEHMRYMKMDLKQFWGYRSIVSQGYISESLLRPRMSQVSMTACQQPVAQR
jgi:hypothetical protein